GGRAATRPRTPRHAEHRAGRAASPTPGSSTRGSLARLHVERDLRPFARLPEDVPTRLGDVFPNRVGQGEVDAPIARQGDVRSQVLERALGVCRRARGRGLESKEVTDDHPVRRWPARPALAPVPAPSLPPVRASAGHLAAAVEAPY